MDLTLGIIAAVLTSIAAIYSAWADELPKWVVAMLVLAAIASVAAIIWTASEQATFEKRVLGGDGFVYATLTPVDDSASRFDLQHAGDDFTVYDVHVEIYDLRKWVGPPTNDPRKLFANMITVDRNVFAPQTMTTTFNTTHPADCFGYWAALTFQRNQNVISVISARMIKGKWESITRVTTMDSERRELKKVASAGWLPTFPEATVELKELGQFNTLTPAVLCPP